MPDHLASRRPSRGFTLVELLVVVVILSFLAVAASGFVTLTESRRYTEAAVEELSLVALLLRLAGLAVLLFGGGFWYLVELHAPGRLDTFRLGHFLLLALTYSVFFAVFAVLGSHEVDAWLAVTIAAAVSYPLLVLHVATIVDLRFALTAALPLAMLTTGLVVNGVYGGAAQSYVYLGCACGVIAFLTVSWPRLVRGHELLSSSFDGQLSSSIEGLASRAGAARTAVAEARALLALQDPPEHAALRTWVEKRVEVLGRTLDDHEQLASLHEVVRSGASRTERTGARASALQLAARLHGRLPHAEQALHEACGTLQAQRSRRSAPAARAEQGVEHCLACGHACGVAARFCPACGTRCAEVRGCRRCNQVLRLPLHLVVAAGSAPAPATHCFHCGELHGA